MARAFIDTTTDYLSVGDVAAVDITGTRISLTFWMRPTAVGGGTVRAPVAKRGTSGLQTQYSVRIIDTTGAVRWAIGDATATDSVDGFIPVVGQWVFAACTYNGTSLKLYRNGKLDAVGASTRTMQNRADALEFGRTNGGTEGYSGDLADVALWDTTLTDDEIYALWLNKSPLLVRPSSLRGYWPLRMAGNANDLTAYNSVATMTGTVSVSPSPLDSVYQRDAVVDPPLNLKRPGTVPRIVVSERFSPEENYNLLVAASNPLAFWPMTEHYRPFRTYASTGQHSSDTGAGALTPSTLPIASRVASAGSNIASVFTTQTDNLTMEIWNYQYAAPAANDQALMYNGNSGADGYGLLMDINLTFQLLRGGVAFGASSTTAVVLNRWHHIVLRRAATTWTYWIDGKQDATAPGTGNPNTPTGAGIIGNVSNSYHTKFAFYTYPLPDAVIREHYYAGLKQFAPANYAAGESSFAPIVLPTSGIGII